MPSQNTFITELFKREYPTLIRKAYRLTGSREHAEDLVQETFLLAVARSKELSSHPSPGAWLSVTILNLAKNERRRIENHPEISLEEVMDFPADEIPSSLGDQLPLQLSEADRQLLIWRFEKQLDYREIASRLGISQGACRIRLSRALKKCKESYQAPGKK